MTVSKKTPMMAQYIKFRNMFDPKTHVLAFRMGDFFEFFNEDAKLVSKILDIACTTRQGMPLAGFPYVSGHENLEKIVKSGYYVVVVDQVEDPSDAKARGAKVVRRDIVRIISPGTILEDGVLDKHSNNYIASLVVQKIKRDANSILVAMAFCDISTGEFFTMDFIDDKEQLSTLTMEFSRLRPVELLIPDDFSAGAVLDRLTKQFPNLVVTSRPSHEFDTGDAREALLSHFKVTNLESFGIEGRPGATSAAGALIIYLQQQQRSLLSNINASNHQVPSRYMQIDHHTIRNLEILQNFADGGPRGTLFELCSRTSTPMGCRLMKKTLLRPLLDIDAINDRLNFVEYLTRDLLLHENFKDALSGIGDLERLISRINYSSTVNARHLVQLGCSLEKIPIIKEMLGNIPLTLANKLNDALIDFSGLVLKIKRTIVDDPPPRISEGKMIRRGVNDELDELRDLLNNSEKRLNEFQERIQREYDLKIKVKSNKIFGYYIEVSKGQLGKVPKSWTRKQTLVNAERYINAELKDLEEKILTAEDRIFEIEREMFMDLKAEVVKRTGDIQKAANSLSEIDVLATFAEIASICGYTKPELTNDGRISIKDGRHPTIEEIIGRDRFIPNDVEIDPDINVLNIITGPNMSGKSTYLRQICLIVLLAQCGSFVPAKHARVGIVDKIFSRVGAIDDITRERSTFVVEMNETAYILNHATRKSLVILDELGRGTSTFDGVSLAWAVAEFLHAKQVKTLFATHYHQLADLELSLNRCKNLNVVVKEDERTKELIFLHKVEPGSCDKSYGIQVARLSGLPDSVITRASEILEKLTHDDPLTTERIQGISSNTTVDSHTGKKTRPKKKLKQTVLFPVPSEIDQRLKAVEKEILKLDLNNITPLDALNILKDLKEKLQK
ncbi:MAG: DNA mismatch repair protein MutS [Promethearchaeota archaeon]